MSEPTIDAPWYTPTIVLRLAGNETLLKPGKPVQRGTAAQVSKWTGISTKTLRRMAEAGIIRESKPTPWLIFYYPGEVEELIAKTEADPAFWNEVRRAAYIEGRRLRAKKPDAPAGELPGITTPADI
ncbi:MAG: hypothetical protein ABIS50_15255 [Luteolibacter sp.]|uniref:hypothetical protein n=1 Tax=Luteolibacter sp. TaxID=1962973 RepID=UPI00326678AF